MKANYLLCALLLLTSCAKENEIQVRDPFVYSKFEFPQGDKDYDDKLIDIYERFHVKCIYEEITRDDLNKSWLSGDVGETGIYGKNLENDQMINFYTTFLCDNVFTFLDPKITKGILPQFIYFVEDYYVRKIQAATGKPYEEVYDRNYDGLDFWGICFFGEVHIGGMGQNFQVKMPQVVLDYIKFKEPLIKVILTRSIQKKLILQAPFMSYEAATDIDFVTPVKNKIGEISDANYFKRRGFPETLRVILKYVTPGTVGNTGSGASAKVSITPSELFIDYLWLGVRYTKEQIYANYAQFPLVIKYYDKVADYMLTNYQLDLNAIAQEPELIPYQ